MSSTSKDLANPVENNKLKTITCVNKCCTDGKYLVPVFRMVCEYYHVKFMAHEKVCTSCIQSWQRHYKNLEMKMKNGQCIMDSHFPHLDLHLVTSASSEDDDDETGRLYVPTTSNDNNLSPLTENVKAGINAMVNHFFEKNKNMLEEQNKQCYNYFNNKLETCEKEGDEIEALIFEAENHIKYIHNNLYSPYRPIITESSPVDLDKSEEVEIENTQKKDNTKEDIISVVTDQLDTEDIIAIDITSVPPSDLPKEGLIEYPPLQDKQLVYAMKDNLIQPWYEAKLKRAINDDYVLVKFESKEKLMTRKEIAFYTPSSVRFPIGSRVIAKFGDLNSEVGKDFYVGVIAEPPKPTNQYRYMIFFDAGYVQYIYHKDIRLVAYKSDEVWNSVSSNSQIFIKSYLKNYPERQMVRLIPKHFVKARYQNQWHTAKVMEIDSSIVKIFFKDLKQSEWMYRGSPRLWNIFAKQPMSEKDIRLRQSGIANLNKPFVEYTSVKDESTVSKDCLTHKSTRKIISSDETVKPSKLYYNKPAAFKVVTLSLPKTVHRPKTLVEHHCNISCIERIQYSYSETVQISMLATPLHFGFKRGLSSKKCISYVAPCGRTIQNMEEMLQYLIVTKSTMTIDQFDFNSWVNPLLEFKVSKSIKYILDLSVGKELKAIACVNNINNELPPPIEYITKREAMPGVHINVDINFLCGCDCTDGCQDKSKCTCWQMTIEGQNILPNRYKDPNIGYNYKRLPERVLSGIYECNATCKCSKFCLNRVVQEPLSQKLQLFKTENKGWGVRCINDIPLGSFICNYVGYMLTETDANEKGIKYGDEYLAELDYIEAVENTKENYESDVPVSDEEEYENNNSSFVPYESSDEYIQTTSKGRSVDSGISLSLGKRKKTQNHKKTKKNCLQAYVPSTINTSDMKDNSEPPKSIRKYFGDNESVYIMDAKTSGNIGRFLNHSCSPNIFVQNVFVDTHDLRFPWISFFALRYIKAGTELTWDYNYDVGSVPGREMNCNCGSDSCRGRLL